LQQPVGRTSELKGTASLPAFAFEPQNLAADIAFDQGRALD
jgi:hypothetical protein